MLKKLNKIIFVFCLSLTSFISFGQNNSNSPYSMFGIGDLNIGNYGRSAAMGGVSTSLYSTLQLNPSNPATYASIMPSTFIFEVGLASNWYTLKQDGNSITQFDANIRTLAIGFPITKWWKGGAGICPVSSVGYDITNSYQQTYSIDTINITDRFYGEGGINSFYIDNSFQILKSISVGIKLAYLFGTLDRNKSVTSSNPLSSTVYVEENSWRVNSFSYGLGAHFHKAIVPNFILNVGAYYNFNTNLAAEFDQLSFLEYVNPSGTQLIDPIVDTTIQGDKIQIPKSLTIGVSGIFYQKLEVAVDYQNDNWSKCKFLDQTLADNNRFSFGLEYTPDAGSTTYLKLIKYRAGFNYTKSYLLQENKQLKQIGGSVGFGFPLKSGAIINLGALYSHRDVPGEDVLSENYFQLNLNFSFKANWFFKRHFN